MADAPPEPPPAAEPGPAAAAEALEDGFVQYVDEESGFPYLYNADTGESRWCDGDEFTPAPQSPPGAAPAPARAAAAGAAASGSDSDAADDEALLRAEPPRPPTAAEIEERTGTVMKVYGWLFLFHGCCCESPMALVEALVRAPLCLLGALLLLGVGRVARARAWLREALLFAAAALTLAVPCVAATMYLEFSPDDPWHVLPLPTLLGGVDPRRFVVFVTGQAGWAANAEVRAGDSLDAWEGDVLLPLNALLAIAPSEEDEMRVLTSRISGDPLAARRSTGRPRVAVADEPVRRVEMRTLSTDGEVSV